MRLNVLPTSSRELIYPSPKAEQSVQAFLADALQQPWLLMHGPVGTGKSEAAQLLMREYLPDAQGPDIQTLNAGVNGGVDDVKAAFSTLRVNGFGSDRRGLIIDEIDRFSGKATADLKGMLDAVQRHRLPIIATTNNLKAVDGAVRSRFEVVFWDRPSADVLRDRAIAVLAANGVLGLTEADVLNLVIQAKNEPRSLFWKILPKELLKRGLEPQPRPDTHEA